MSYHQKITDIITTCLTENQKPELDHHFINDGNHFLLMQTGWQAMERICRPLLYVRLCEGKIWIEQDESEYNIVERLCENGVPHEDIVLGFHHPHIRPLLR